MRWSKLREAAGRWVRRLFSRQEQEFLLMVRPEVAGLIERIRAKHLTYLSASKLSAIALACQRAEDASLPGLFVETGCALGGSTILIGSLKGPQRKLQTYDVFGMIPPPTEQDPPEVHERYQTIVKGESTGIGGDRYYGYEVDLLSLVRRNLAEFGLSEQSNGIALVQGLVEDTLVINQPVALAHIDVDWYEPVRTSLQQVMPWLVVGGSVILDDYYCWGGCRKAVDEYLQANRGQFELDGASGSLVVTRIMNA